MPEPGLAVAPPGTYLAFDFGLRRIGVAVGQTTTCTASPLAVVTNGSVPDWAALDKLIQEWCPVALVLGLPLDGEAQETDMSRAARRFGAALEQRYGLPVHYNDERMSSLAAGERFREQRAAGGARRKDAARMDAVAAGIILERWLARRRTADGVSP
jgi:putative Holliday junction resolvase